MTDTTTYPSSKPSQRSLPALALLAATLAMPVAAHDIVLVPETSGVRVRMGHPGDWQSVDGERLLELQVFDGADAGADRQAALKRKGLDLVLAAPVAGKAPMLAAARYDNGLWVKLPAVAGAKPQWRNTSRFMTPGADNVMASVKFAKGLAHASGDNALFGRQFGHLLELVPQKNPLDLKAGETLPVLVLYNGKPLEGAGIEVSNLVDKLPEERIKRYPTDATGIAQVTLRASGINTLAVDVERPNDGSLGDAAKALPVDKVLMVATYTFVR